MHLIERLLLSGAESADASTLPPGYKFHGMVEFTDVPNTGRPHLHLASAEEDVEHPEEEWHTILVTPDGRAYRKP